MRARAEREGVVEKAASKTVLGVEVWSSSEFARDEKRGRRIGRGWPAEGCARRRDVHDGCGQVGARCVEWGGDVRGEGSKAPA